METSPNQSVFSLLEVCVAFGDAEDWLQLFCVTERQSKSLIGNSHLDSLAAREEFRNWFVTWGYLNWHRFERAYQTVDGHQHPEAAERDRHTINYLRRVVRTALREHRREVRQLSSTQMHQLEKVQPLPSQNEPGGPSSHLARESLERALSELDYPLRAPFRLRYYQVFSAPPRDELQWITETCGRPAPPNSPESVLRDIQQEAKGKERLKFPLKSEFIGWLLGISRIAVDQRVRRAKRRLAECLDLPWSFDFLNP